MPAAVHVHTTNILSPISFTHPTPSYMHSQEVLDWFTERKLHAYSISAGQSLLYNDIFPKHKERLNKKMSELVVSEQKHKGLDDRVLNVCSRVSVSRHSNCRAAVAVPG